MYIHVYICNNIKFSSTIPRVPVPFSFVRVVPHRPITVLGHLPVHCRGRAARLSLRSPTSTSAAARVRVAVFARSRHFSSDRYPVRHVRCRRLYFKAYVVLYSFCDYYCRYRELYITAVAVDRSFCNSRCDLIRRAGSKCVFPVHQHR